MLKVFGTGLLAAVTLVSLGVFAPAHATTVTSSYSYVGDICDDFDTDGGVSGTDFNDCDQIVFEDRPVGTFAMELLGLRAHIVSDAIFTFSVRVADVFAVGGGNNAGERFGISLDTLFLGTLFDQTTADEALISPGLAASVQASIDASTSSDGSLDLSFAVSGADIAPSLQDGRLTALLDFQGDVNSMRDIDFSVTYTAVPLPASGLVLAFGLVGLFALRRKQIQGLLG